MSQSRNEFGSFTISDDIDAIIARGEERTAELASKWEGLTFEDLSNFKSEANIQTWEGEDFQSKVGHLLHSPLFSVTQICNSNSGRRSA